MQHFADLRLLICAQHVQEEAQCEHLVGLIQRTLTGLQIKPLSPLKSSDRRRTADQIIADFGIEVPVDSGADPEDKAASSAGLTALRKSLLPENSLSARFTTTAGPDLKQVSGTVYVGSHEGTGNEQRMLWAKVGEMMYPTGMYRIYNAYDDYN